MPTLTIGDQSVQVDDSFLQLDPIQQNATVEEIAKSLGASAPPQAENSLAGSAKAVGSGLVSGLTGIAGLPADALNLAARGVDYLSGNSNVAKELSGLTDALGSEGINKAIGNTYQPQTGTEKFLNTTASFAPAALLGPGGIARRIATNVVVPGVASEAAGQATEGTPYEPVARIAGALGGASKIGRMADLAIAKKALPPVPTGEQIAQDTSARYNTPAIQGLEINPIAVKPLVDDTQAKLSRFSQKNSGVAEVNDILEKLRTPEAGNTNKYETDFEETRRLLSGIQKRGGTEGEAARIAKENIDTMLPQILQRPGAVVSGDATQAVLDMTKARATAAVGFRSEKLDSFLERAGNTAAATHSGGNLENEIYKQVRNALNNPKRDLLGWSAQEKEALRAVLPGRLERINRRAAKVLGGGGGLGQLASGAAGASMFGPAGAIGLPALGMGLNKLGSTIAQNKLERVGELLRSRAPSYAPHYAEFQRLNKAGKPLDSLPPAQLQALLALIAAQPKH